MIFGGGNRRRRRSIRKSCNIVTTCNSVNIGILMVCCDGDCGNYLYLAAFVIYRDICRLEIDILVEIVFSGAFGLSLVSEALICAWKYPLQNKSVRNLCVWLWKKLYWNWVEGIQTFDIFYLILVWFSCCLEMVLGGAFGWSLVSKVLIWAW